MDTHSNGSGGKRDVTLRSVVIGAILMPVNALWLAVTEVVWISGQPTTLSLFYHVVFMLFWLVVGNLAVKKLRPAWALSPHEMLVVYSMLSIASAIGSLDFVDVLVPMLPNLHRYHAMEGRYAEFIDLVPDWLVVSDPAAVQAYYLGQESIFDWGLLSRWVTPVAWWVCFIIALCAVLLGLDLVFRKQWTEHEKLAYPVIQLPMRLTSAPGELFRTRLFWLGFAIAAGISLINGLNVLFPLLPSIPVVHIVNLQTFFPRRPWSDMGWVPVSFYPFAIGMCFFMPLDLAFSCWFFYFFWKGQRVLASHIGMHGMPGFPFVEEQTAGGYYTLALIALWVSRRQLARMAGLLMGRGTGDATPWERREVWCATGMIAAGGAFLAAFSLRAGMSVPVMALFFVLYFLISISVTRMRAELGPPSHDLHHIGPNQQLVKFVGAREIRGHNPRDLAMLGFYQWFNRAYRGNPMPHGMEGFRIAERFGMSRGRYLAAMCVAVVLGALCAFGGLLVMMYFYGASQVSGLGDWFGTEAWTHVDNWFTAPQPRQGAALAAVGIGLAFSMGLAALRMSLAWWPFHPVGYAISGSWSMDQLWMSFLAAWLIKALLLKYGGAKAYTPAIPFFLGLIVGDFVIGSFWNIYGSVMEVSVYQFWPY